MAAAVVRWLAGCGGAAQRAVRHASSVPAHATCHESAGHTTGQDEREAASVAPRHSGPARLIHKSRVIVSRHGAGKKDRRPCDAVGQAGGTFRPVPSAAAQGRSAPCRQVRGCSLALHRLCNTGATNVAGRASTQSYT